MPHRPDPGTNQLVAFTLGDRRYGLPLSAVDRIVRVVDVTSLPKVPDIVLGVVNVQGRVIPLVNVRRRFQLPEREIALTDQMVLARAARRPVALVVDSVTGVLEYSKQEAVGDVIFCSRAITSVFCRNPTKSRRSWPRSKESSEGHSCKRS